MTKYTTNCVTWDRDTEAASPVDAAVKHAIDGWEDEEPSKREPTVVVVADPAGALYRFRVAWDLEAGPIAEEQWPAPRSPRPPSRSSILSEDETA